MDKLIKNIFLEDQSDRIHVDFLKKRSYYQKRDRERRSIIETILKSKEVKTGEDFYCSAMIFHHSGDIDDLKLAKNLVQKSVNLKYEKSKWLYAAITDRILLAEGKVQKFGTQYVKKNKNSPWLLAATNPKTTDKERTDNNVPPMKEILKEIDKLNNF